MNDKLVMLIVLLFLLVLLAVNVFISKRQAKILKMELENHNQKVLFSEISFNIGEECYKTCDFFKMHNTGKKPCEDIGKIKYDNYSKKADYWMKRKM